MKETNGLVRGAVAGDLDALSKLLGHHGPEVERKLRIDRKWRSVLDPADVMQVTYIEAFLQISHFDPARSEFFQAWLRRIAENNLRDAIRDLQRHKRAQPFNRIKPDAHDDGSSELLVLLGGVTTTPSRYASRDERASRLDVLLDTLPEDYCHVVRLYDLDGLPIGEVAKRMERSPGAVHMLRARAHDRLREVLGAESAWFSSSS